MQHLLLFMLCFQSAEFAGGSSMTLPLWVMVQNQELSWRLPMQSCELAKLITGRLEGLIGLGLVGTALSRMI